MNKISPLQKNAKLRNVQTVVKSENHHFSTPNEISVSSKNHQCVLKPLSERLMRNWNIDLVPMYHPQDTCWLQVGKHNFEV